MTEYFYGMRDEGPTGPVRDLQRALMIAGVTLPKYGDDGDLGAEVWQALGLVGTPTKGERLPRSITDTAVSLLPPIPTPRRVPIETKRSWPARGARAWLAERAEGARLHAGVDLGGTDDRILAPEACVVERVIKASYGGRTPRFSTPAGWGGYGPYAVLLKAMVSETWHLLAHVDRVLVEPGLPVAKGNPIASVAAIGNHLHWEVRVAATAGAGAAVVEIVLDPGSWLYGIDRRWVHGVDPCPRKPERSARTPRACRPTK